MPNEPSAGELLHTAHWAMKERILPALPKDLRSEGAMIARVLAIALAELRAQDDTEKRILGIWADVYPDLREEPMTLSALEARIVQDISSGRFDSIETRDRIELALQEHAALQLATSNPKFIVPPSQTL